MHKKIWLALAAASLATLACDDDAGYNSDKAVCNNSKIEAPEICDGEHIGDKTCADFDSSKTWVEGGVPACASNCLALEKGSCEEQASNTCNGTAIDQGEVCDGEHIGDKTCADFDSSKTWAPGGVPTCASNCLALEKGTCEEQAPSTCNGAAIDQGEVCDGVHIGDKTCADFDSSKTWAPGGVPTCASNCLALEKGTCEEQAPNTCDGKGIDQGELCDGLDIGDKTCADFDSTKTWAQGGFPACSTDCLSLEQGSCVLASFCGDQQIDPPEECEERGIKLCTDIDSDLYEGGVASCMNCRWDRTNCVIKVKDPFVYCQLVEPIKVDLSNQKSVKLEGRLHILGVTDKSPGLNASKSLRAELVYGSDFSDIQNWKTIGADGRSDFTHPTDDAYVATLNSSVFGNADTLYYTYRFSADNGQKYKYCKLTKDGKRLPNNEFHNVSTDPPSTNVNTMGVATSKPILNQAIVSWNFDNATLDATTGAGTASLSSSLSGAPTFVNNAGGKAWSIQGFSTSKDRARVINSNGTKINFANIDASKASSLVLNFSARVNAGTGVQNIIVRYSLDGGTTYVQASTSPDIQLLPELSIFHKYSHPLPAAVDNAANLAVQLIPYNTTSNTSAFHLDDVSITQK